MARIVIIEDNDNNLALMSYLLTAFGHTVECYRDGQSGLAAVQANPPDLVLCDIQLPVLSGHDVARTLRGDAKWRALPLVAVTALAMRGDRERVMASGFTGYIEKPIRPELLAAEVEAFLKAAAPVSGAAP
jgi:CheY-like chemotaxis protein